MIDTHVALKRKIKLYKKIIYEKINYIPFEIN